MNPIQSVLVSMALEGGGAGAPGAPLLPPPMSEYWPKSHSHIASVLKQPIEILNRTICIMRG